MKPCNILEHAAFPTMWLSMLLRLFRRDKNIMDQMYCKSEAFGIDILDFADTPMHFWASGNTL